MREQLNNNPVAQIAVVAVLLVASGFFLISTMGGGDEDEAGGGAVSATVNGAPGSGATPGEAVDDAVQNLEAGGGTAPTAAPVPDVAVPAKVTDAWQSGAIVVLLFVREGGIDDGLVEIIARSLGPLPGVTEFIVPAKQISRYSAITGGVGVERVPALVVLTPKGIAGDQPTASVHYGFQSPASVVQAVIDAGYDGPTRDYHP